MAVDVGLKKLSKAKLALGDISNLLLSDDEAVALTMLGAAVYSYDPTMSCDNKCLRRGYCDSCPHFILPRTPF